ncbi:hypothetical protein [Tropicimonas sp. IMCC6043]|uniref:hypothetical protein n=1 Tax=Tropicimonas sp. IMCC6043 TaxID=2510645 RepID=UPI00101D54C1|nr:hypothetical protein [Tropicimonas sp. IMCC6043]RYH10661.1 hypothetical protein EU800_07950 [Tropicimonas sp. IMCC6043]
MTRITAILFAAALAAVPTATPAQDSEVKDGFNLIEEGAKLLLKGLADEMQPMMEDLATEMEPKLRAFAEEMAPMLERFSDLVDDLDAYHPPERLPNGDIILRRKTPQEMEEVEEGGKIDI